MLDPNQRKLTQDILDWLDRPAFTVEYGPGDDYRYVSCNTAYAALTEMNAEALAGQGLSAGFALGEVTKVRDLLDMTRRENRRQIGNPILPRPIHPTVRILLACIEASPCCGPI